MSWQGQPLPYLPYAYRHPEYWQRLVDEARSRGDKAAARDMFDESERRHLLREEEKTKVERIHGAVIRIGAEDDAPWNTCRYIRRMEERLAALPHECRLEAWLYEHGTHFTFPESMLKMMLPVGSSLLVSTMFRAGREHPRKCWQTRMDIDTRLKARACRVVKEGTWKPVFNGFQTPLGRLMCPTETTAERRGTAYVSVPVLSAARMPAAAILTAPLWTLPFLPTAPTTLAMATPPAMQRT